MGKGNGKGSQKEADEKADGAWRVDFHDEDKRSLPVLIVLNTIKCSLVLCALYLFICSLSFLADGFRLVAGKQAGEVFRDSEVFNNPVAGCMVGLLVTVLVQSSSTSTSIVITMVAAELLTVKQAIPLIMGATMGTSVTSTIVAMGQVGNRDEFRRAFAAATVHDMFNVLNTIILLPVEAATGYLYKLSLALVESQNLTEADKPPDMLKKLTKPLTKAIIEVDKKIMSAIATETDPDELASLYGKSMIKSAEKSDALLAGTSMSDNEVGIMLLVLSLAVLCICLYMIVSLLKSMLKGRVAVWLHRSVNGEVPGCPFLAGYMAIFVGAGVTIMVQSSSITTSALTPLVGLGVINIERMYPTVLGANIGTCVTGALAALAADSEKLGYTLQVAYAHLFFNITGIVIWYVIWPMRAIPINMSKFLGSVVFEYRWFALVYIAVVFFAMPAIFVGLSSAGNVAVIGVTAVIALVAAFITIVNIMNARAPDALPGGLKDWACLPLYCKSLEPIDRVVCGPLTAKCCSKKTAPNEEVAAIEVTTDAKV
jgi:sodium-dependent phosphate cotransporter